MIIICYHIIIVYRYINILTCLSLHSVTFRAIVYIHAIKHYASNQNQDSR